MPLDELSDVSLPGPSNGEVLKYDGSQWVSAPDLTGTAAFTAGPGIDISGNVISNTGDLDPSDDLTIGSSAGGDLAGTYPNPTVVGIQGSPISPVTPATGQVFKWSGGASQWIPAADEVDDADADPVNEIQTLSLSGFDLTLTQANTISLPQYQAGTAIQVFPLGGNQFLINNIGDPDPTDDINSGDPAGGDLAGTYPNPTVLRIQGHPIQTGLPGNGDILRFLAGQWSFSSDQVDDADADPSNEIQSLSLTGNQLSLSSANSVSLPASPWTEANGAVSYAGTAAVDDTLTLRNGSGDARVRLGIANDEGFVQILDGLGAVRAGLRITAGGQAEVFGDVKNFRMDHPTQPDREIWYASLEGPEAAAYLRGTAELIDGRAQVNFPEHFQLVASEAGMTVLLTPLSGQSKGLAVVKKDAQGFAVVELLDGRGNYAFDWEVKCVRRGHESFDVIREKQ